MRNENVRDGSDEYLRRIANLNDENISHLFWGCRWVNDTIRATFNRLTGDNNRHVSKNRYFGGWELKSRSEQEVLLIVVHYKKYITYVCRNRRVIMSVAHVYYELDGLLGKLNKREKWRTFVMNVGEMLRGIYELL